MFSIIRQGDSDQYGIVSYCCDSVTDVADLPKEDNVGSTCFVIENSTVYMLGNDKEWHEI